MCTHAHTHNRAIESLCRKENLCALLAGMEINLVQPLWRIVWGFHRKLKIELLYDLAITVLHIHPKELKSLCQRDLVTLVFMVAYSE
jgi:hypothetical protein